jgi:hypothetical protein
MNHAKPRIAVSLLLVALVALTPSLAKSGAKVDSNGIVRPDAKYRGKTYPEWAAAFWQWSLGLPLEGHPFIDDPEFDFSAHQSGPVWFWSAPDGPLERVVTLPEGKALFLTLRDVECSSLEDPPFFGATEEEQREVAAWFADHIVDVFCTIDGVSVENLQDFRFSTDQFEFDAPTPWIFGATGGAGTAVGDGYFLMLAPMSKGHHTIHYGGTFHFEAGELGEEPVDFPKDITIQLTVE